MTFSERLKSLMKQYDYTQAELAEMLNITQQTVSRWVNGKFQPDIDQLIALGKIFNTSVDDILGQSAGSPVPITKKAQSATDDELRARAIARISQLSEPALLRVLDFLSGLQAYQEIQAAEAADPDPDDQSPG